MTLKGCWIFMIGVKYHGMYVGVEYYVRLPDGGLYKAVDRQHAKDIKRLVTEESSEKQWTTPSRSAN